MQADLTPPVCYVTVEMDPCKNDLTPPVYYVTKGWTVFERMIGAEAIVPLT